MTRVQLYRSIRKLNSIKNHRHPMFEKNRFMKVLGWFMILYYAAILLFMGTLFPIGMSGAYYGVAAFHVFDGFFPWVLIVDFWIRFVLQDTPVQNVKPYRLLPVRRNFLMHTYLAESGFSGGNLFWGFMLVPFGAIAVLPLLGWSGFLLWLLCWWMMCIANGFMYLFTRALCIKNILWCLVPAAIHGGLIALMVVPDKNPLDMPCTRWLYSAAEGNLFPFAALAILICFWYWANFRLQMSMLYDEIGRAEDIEIKSTSQMNWLNRWGSIGEYLKMEIKLRLRNKQVRMQFLVCIGAILFFTAIQFFSEVYDGTFMKSFICMYNYIILGMMTLVTIMCYEGNYIDCLVSRRQSIYFLLCAKFYFNTVALMLPFLLTSPLMFIGKLSPWISLGYMFLTSGIMYPLLFQMAVYNSNTLPLNQKLMGKQGDTRQQIVAMVAMAVPMCIERFCVVFLGEIWGGILLVILGSIGIVTHRYWIRNVYNRMMKRRYTNLEGFHASRNS